MQEMIDIYDSNKQPTGETMAREGAFLREELRDIFLHYERLCQALEAGMVHLYRV